jgi:type I restriction enzyme S subunit
VRFSSVDKKSNEDELPVRLCNYTDVYYRDSITPDLPFMEATATPNELREFSLHEGDVLITKDSESPDDIGIPSYVSFSDKRVLCGYHLAQLRPVPSLLNGRFLFWWMASDTMREELSARANGITRFGLKLESIAAAPIRVPEMTEQRAIADFLDRETARIDALISARRWMLDLLEERRVRRAAIVLGDGTEGVPGGWRVLPIRRLCPNVTVGVVVDPSSYFQPSGIPFIHGSDVRDGWIDESNFKFLSPQDNATLWKSRLSAGDVIAMRVGEPGRSAVVPAHLEGANCASVLIFRKSPQLASEILSAFLNSPLGKAQIASFQYGAAQGVMNVEHALQLRVPVPPAKDQPKIVALLHGNESQSRRSRGMLTRQVELLAERRQSLITAAVTGQLAISSAA